MDHPAQRALRTAVALARILGVGLIALTAVSVLAFGAVHSWAYVPLWLVVGALGTLLALRVGLILFLRRRLGPRRISLDRANRVIVSDPREGISGAVDLGAPPLPRPPLLWPGLAFAALVCVQLLPWPPAGKPLTVDAGATLRGLAFVASLLIVHLVAASVFTRRSGRDRYRAALAALGTLIGIVALVQAAGGASRIFGLFAPEEGSGGIYGPFVNRNSFAGYMLMVVPVCLQRLVRVIHATGGASNEPPGLRLRLLALTTGRSASALLATVPVLVGVASLVATRSRGGLLALLIAFLLGGLVATGRRRSRIWAVPIPFVALALVWFGPELLHARFARSVEDSPGRVEIWTDALRRMDGRWLTGTGFNTFAAAMSRGGAWSLPRGATPWPSGVDVSPGARPAFRALDALPGLAWHREAHNDYVQVLVETGVPGLVIALWAATRLLLHLRGRPWLFIAESGVLLHCFVDYDLQIPAVALLFAILAAMAPPPRAASN